MARSQSSEDDCRSGYICLKRSMCSPTAMKQIIGSPKTCGKSKRGASKICCPLSTPTSFAKNIQETKFQEPCGLKGEDFSVNDTEMTNGRWPWMVSLNNERREMERFLCSGFLIDRQHVVTAAHCVKGNRFSLEKLLVRIGSVSYREGELYNVTRIVIPDGYNARMFYDDIALLTLSREVEYPHFNPVCLPTANSIGVLEGLEGTLVGYVGQDLGIKLREKNGVPIISSEECETTFRKLLSTFFSLFPKGINNQILCTGGDEKYQDSCKEYYSGSPLMVEKKGRWFVVGVSSFGMSGCRSNVPNGFTSVTEYVDWIKQNIE